MQRYKILQTRETQSKCKSTFEIDRVWQYYHCGWLDVITLCLPVVFQQFQMEVPQLEEFGFILNVLLLATLHVVAGVPSGEAGM